MTMPTTTYDPMSTFKPDRRIGRYIVRGNDCLATVIMHGLTVHGEPCTVYVADNRDGPPDGQPASAFERAAEWATKQGSA